MDTLNSEIFLLVLEFAVLKSHADFFLPYSEVFLSDQTSNLFALDLRTGRVLYGYQGWETLSIKASVLIYFSLLGISGTITSLACAPHHVGTTSLDRFFRLHGTASEASAKDGKGQTLEKVYTKSVPTVVVWDSSYEDRQSSIPESDGAEGDQVWEDMENAEDDGATHDEDEDEPSPNSSYKKSRTR